MAKLDFTNKKNPFETQEEQTSNIEIKPNSVVKIPTDLIDLGENIRDVYTDYEEELYELGESIKQVGQLQPCTVYQKGDRYILKYGSRRFKACLKAEIPTVDCIVSTEFKDEKERILTQAIENEHRKDMTDRERESYINELRKMGMSIEQIAHELKKSKGWISKSLKAYEQREKNADLLAGLQGEVDTATMYQFDRLSNEKLNEFIEEVKKEDNTSESLGIKVRKEVEKQKQEKKAKENNESIDDTISDPFDINFEIEEETEIEEKQEIIDVKLKIIKKEDKIKINNLLSNDTELNNELMNFLKNFYQNKGFIID